MTAKYNLNVQTSVGELRLPICWSHFTLQPRTTDLIVTDLSFGNSHLIYTTTSVLFTGILDGRDVLVLYGDTSYAFEAMLRPKGENHHLWRDDKIKMQGDPSEGVVVSILPGFKGLIELWDSDEQLILYCDTTTAETLYAPILEKENDGMTDTPFGNFWGIGTDATVLIGGPYLVRRAVISGDNNDVLALEGDISGETMLRIIGAPRNLRRITWNGFDVEGLTCLGKQAKASIKTGVIRPREETLSISTCSESNPDSGPVLKRTWTIPSSGDNIVTTLGPWKYQDSLPEIDVDFDDSDWLVAGNSTTNSHLKPYFGDGPVLYACDYGFCEGAVLWRGSFYGDRVTGARLVINGGRGNVFIALSCSYADLFYLSLCCERMAQWPLLEDYLRKVSTCRTNFADNMNDP